MPPEKSARRLGRGLDALFKPESEDPDSTGFRELPIAQIGRNPLQPRKSFDPEDLRELQESLRSSGLLQPITVRPAKAGNGFELVAGERRLRAATSLGWTAIPAVIKDVSDKEMLTLALVENLQRADLNPIEEAEGYDKLIKEFGYTQQTVAEMVGKDRSTVANGLRILQLPISVKKLMEEGKLTAGQARPLLGLEDGKVAVSFATQTVEHGWSAREVERRVREAANPRDIAGKTPAKTDTRPAEIRSLEQRLRKHLQTDVSITLKRGNRGSLIVDFYSPDDLDRLLDLIGVPDIPQ